MRLQFSYGVLLLLMVMAGCRPETVCRKEMAPQMQVGLYTIHHLTDGGTEVTTGVDSITIHALGKDSVIADNSKSMSRAVMPLRTDSAVTMFVMSYHGMNDTVSVFHSNNLQYISMECGCNVLQTIDSVTCTLHGIEQAETRLADIISPKDENIIIYFRP